MSTTPVPHSLAADGCPCNGLQAPCRECWEALTGVYDRTLLTRLQAGRVQA